MRDLVRDLVTRRRSRRRFLTDMMAAGYTLTAARSALASVSPLGPGQEANASLTRSVTGTGGELLAEQLIEAGCKYLFVCNGSGVGPVCDALVDRPQVQLIQAVDEGLVVCIADGYAKASGKIGFGMYSRVGLPNSSANMYNSMKDRTPVVLLSDHAETNREGTDSHEDIDDWLEPIKQYTKWRWVAHQPDRIPEWIRQACTVASVLPGGPTYVRMPRDLLYQPNVTSTIFTREAFNIPMEIRPDPKLVEEAARVLINSSSPILYAGPEVGQCNARASIVKLAELLGMPMVQARSFFDDVPTTHPLSVGELGSMSYPETFDCFVNFGARFPVRQARGIPVIHATVEPGVIGRNTPLRVPLLGHLDQVARDLIDAIASLAPKAALAAKAAERRAAAEASTSRTRQARLALARRSAGSPVPWQRLMVEMEDLLDPDAVIIDEIGTEGKILNFFAFAENAKLKIGRTEGRSLGWGVGASIGVKLALPNRQVVSFQGDGGFLFGQTEALWTMSRYDIPVMTVIMNNRSYEEVRWNILSEGGASGKAGRDYICDLSSPDVEYAKIAAAYGITGEMVNNTDDLRAAIERGIRTLRDGRPYLLDVRIAQSGLGAGSTYYQKFSLAKQRERQV